MFPQYREIWRSLNERTSRSPALDPDFVEPLLDVFGRGSERLAVYGDPAAPLAMGLLTQRKPGVWETFQPHQAPVAPWLMDPGIALEPLLKELLRAVPSVGLLVGLTQQDPALAPRPDSSRYLRTLDYIQTARIPVHGSFESYWAARGKNLRSNLKKQRSRLIKEAVQAHLEILDSAEAVAAAIDDYGRLESSGWKSQAGTAVSSANSQGRFYGEALRRFAQHKRAIIFRYWLNGRVAAMDLCILHHGVLIILKTAYDESHAPYSPASLMREDAFRWIFARGDVRMIEFYGRLMEWHRKWADEIRTMYHVNYYRWQFLPALLQFMPGDIATPLGS